MNGEDDPNIAACSDLRDGARHARHCFKILAAVRCNDNDFLVGEPIDDSIDSGAHRRISDEPSPRREQCVDHCVARLKDRVLGHRLAPQRVCRRFGRGKMLVGHRGDDLAVYFLRPGMVDVAAAQPCLDV